MADNFQYFRNGVNIGTLSSAPNHPVNGDQYYDSTLGVMRAYQGGAWTSLGPLSATPAAIIGQLVFLASSNTPAGVLVCDGSAVSRTGYPALFAQIGTIYGTGDGSTTFNLPDYRGIFVRGWDNGAGNDPDTASRVEFHTLSTYTITGNTNGIDNTVSGLNATDYNNVAIGQQIQSDVSSAIPVGAIVIGKSLGTTITLSVNTTMASTGDVVTLTQGATGDYVGSYQPDVFGSHNHLVYGYSYTSAAPGGGTPLASNYDYEAINYTAANGGSETRPKNNYAMIGIVYDSNLALGVQVAPFYASSLVTTLASSSSPSWTTVSNSPALTFSPGISGTYKVYASIPLQGTAASGAVPASARIYNTSGGATLLYESDSTAYGNDTSTVSSGYTMSVYTLTAGNTYVFDIQVKIASDSAYVRGDFANFYMFAELASTAVMGGGGGGSGITELTGDVSAAGTGTVSSTVNSVGGQTASAIAAATVIANSLSNASTGTAGSNAIGDDDSYSHFTPTAATVKGALQGIDNALAGVLAGAVTSLTGDVTGTGPGATATTVVSVGGQSAANIASATEAVAASTTTGAASSLVATDANGNITAQNFFGKSSSINLPIGDTFTASTSYTVILGVNSQSQTAGSIYLAQASNAAANGTFWCIGIAAIGATTTVGTLVPVTTQGVYTLQSGDTAFSTAQIGMPCYVNDGGAFTTTAPSTPGQAVYKIGVVLATNQIYIDGKQLLGIN